MSTGLNVIFIPNNEDNYCYYCYKNDIDQGFFVDICESNKAIDFANAVGIDPKYVLTTHKHWDHSNGNTDMAKEFPDIKIYGGEKDQVKACTDPVSDGDIFKVGGMIIECMHTPCHTKGHICYIVTADDSEESKGDLQRLTNEDSGHKQVTGFSRAAFTGDTLFVGTVGKFFEGTAEGMHKNLERLMILPSDTQIFSGHEYTVASLEFCKKMDQENPMLEEILENSKNLIGEGFPSLPVTIDIVK
jgi:hydroxyacylglutathione hydrolase